GETVLVIALLRAMERRRRARLELRERLHFEQLISQLSRGFINLPSEKIEAQIKEALQKVGEDLKFDIAAFSTLRGAGVARRMSILWRKPSVKEVTCAGLEEELPWSAGELTNGRDVWLPSMSSLPPEGETDRVAYSKFGVLSAYQVPLYAGGKVMAAFSLCAV